MESNNSNEQVIQEPEWNCGPDQDDATMLGLREETKSVSIK